MSARDTVNYRITNFESTTGIITVQFEDIHNAGTYRPEGVCIQLPVVDGVYPTGNALETLIRKNYPANLFAHAPVANNATDIANLVSLPTEEMLLEQYWEKLRSERNMLLEQSDCTQLPDYPISDAKRIEWKGYRQRLREFPSTIENPIGAILPKAPD